MRPVTEGKMMTDEFKTYHPIINFLYFAFMIVCSCIFMHPVCLFISLAGAFTYSIMQNGKKSVKTNILYMLPTVLVMALLNPLFNHQGVTILAYFPDENPLTFESIIYGIDAAVMVISVIAWFGCCNRIMTSDKMIYLFGRIVPSLSLVLSMTMRFIPKFAKDTKKVCDAQRGIGFDINKGKITTRMKTATKVVSVMLTRSLENSIETADSMKSRGYGTKKRTAFSVFRFDSRDVCMLVMMLIFGAVTVSGVVLGGVRWQYYPQLNFTAGTPYAAITFIAYGMMAFMPVIIDIWEGIRWNVIKSKI